MHALREDLDLVGRTEDDADLLVADRRERVRAVRRRAGHFERHGACVSGHVRDVEHGALGVDEEEGPDAVTHPVEALDPGERLGIAIGQAIARRTGGRRSIFIVQHEHARRNRMVLIAGQRRNPQNFDGCREQVGAWHRRRVASQRVEERAHVPVFDRAAEQFRPLQHLLGIEDRAISQREHRSNGTREVDLVRSKRTARGHVEHVPRSEPANRQHRGIVRGFDGEPPVGGQRRNGLCFEGGAAEELPQRRLQQVVVQCACRKNGRESHEFSIIIHLRWRGAP